MPGPTGEPPPGAPEQREVPPSVGVGGCLVGFLAGGLVLAAGTGLLALVGIGGSWHTILEIGVMGLALGAALFVWKVAATADEMARDRERDRDEG